MNKKIVKTVGGVHRPAKIVTPATTREVDTRQPVTPELGDDPLLAYVGKSYGSLVITHVSVDNMGVLLALSDNTTTYVQNLEELNIKAR